MKAQIPFTAEVKYEGHILLEKSDGFVGRLLPGKATIEVNPEPGNSVFAFNVNKNKNLSENLFKKNIAIYKNGNGVVVADSQNSFILLEFFEPNNLKVWEVSLTGWRGNFYLKKQILHSAFLFFGGTSILIPYFKHPLRKWPQLCSVVEDLVYATDLAFTIPSIEKYEDGRKCDMCDLPSHAGRVVFFSWARMFGAIECAEGVAMVHSSELPKRPWTQIPYLKVGEIVHYDHVEPTKPRAGKVNTFSIEAIGITPLAP
ncbi:hypothetical protein HYT00_03715 [Candidatus Giovannonibacteria bacterium]|nr:hypothetical protein [Candidatus Giovannonibacteria bacterium]